MLTTNLETLKIHKLTQEQYDRELAAGNIDENALYLTPDEAVDLSGYVTSDQLGTKADADHTHDDRYYTESEIDSKLSTINTSITNITGGTTKVASATKADTATSATSASALSTARKITLGGDASGSVSFDGSKDVTLTVTVADDSHNHTIANVDGLQTALDGKAASDHNHDSDYDAKGAADTALASAKTYADSAAATVKNELLNGAGTAYDTLKELGDLIDDNQDAIDALETVAAGKADKTHSHAIADVTGLQTALDGKAASSHGTHVTFSTTAPVMDGTASVGSATTVARSDHKHPTDTSRASKSEFDTHVADTTAHITSTERTNWGTAYTHSQAAHAPSNAEKNQNAFSNVKVGTTTIAADTTTDTLTLVAGSNVTITPDATNDKITIAATDTVYTHPTSGVTAGTYKSVTVNAQGHVTAGSNPTTLAGYGITDAAAKSHTHAISDITNLQTTLNNASSAISANTSSISGHTTRIEALEEKVGDGFEEITSAEIQALFA